MPATRVIAHLGVRDQVFIDNLKIALAASRKGKEVCIGKRNVAQKQSVTVEVNRNLLYLPLALISYVFRRFGLHTILDRLMEAPTKGASLAQVIETLVIQRCVSPDSKLALQQWMDQVAISEVVGCAKSRLNNTRVHWAMDRLFDVEETLQNIIQDRITNEELPRILYLDLTDTWFESGGGTRAKLGKTKQGHRSKKKINIALMVNEKGLPMRWKVLPGALSETTVLPEWIRYLSNRSKLKRAVLIFDRGLPSMENFKKLLDESDGHMFLTSVKSDSIGTYVKLDHDKLDTLQNLKADAESKKVKQACKKLNLTHLANETYALDCGTISAPKPKTKRQKKPPDMRGYLYFNREIQITKRTLRQERIDKVYDTVETLNKELRNAKQTRKEDPTRRKITKVLEKVKLLEIFTIQLTPYLIKGKTTQIGSFQVKVTLRKEMLRNMCRFDGITLLVGHPDLPWSITEAIAAYRNKTVVEADFRTIKSVLKLRPVNHREDPKIDSHITICVMALLVERLIELQLNSSSCRQTFTWWPKTAEALRMYLHQVFLNQVKINDSLFGLRTKSTPQVEILLQSLGAAELLNRYKHTVEVPMT